MPVFSAFVVFALIWTMVFLISLQVGQRTQGDAGERVPGTHASSPAAFKLRARLVWTTLIAVALWSPLVWFIVSGQLSIGDLRRWTGREQMF